MLKSNIKEVRIKAGMTQAQLAHRSGHHTRYIQKIENERDIGTCSLNTLLKIADALHTDLYALFERETNDADKRGRA